jgi:hypothetical protein
VNKSEEIQLLEQFAESLDGDTYLSHLFTPNMIGWVAEQIRGDIFPDLHQWMLDADAAGDQKAKELREKLAEKDREIAEITTVKGNLEAALIAANRTVESQKDTAAEMRRGWSKDADRLIDAQAKAERLKGETVALKARLYDLMVGEEEK